MRGGVRRPAQLEKVRMSRSGHEAERWTAVQWSVRHQWWQEAAWGQVGHEEPERPEDRMPG